MGNKEHERENEAIMKVESLVWFKCNCKCVFCSVGDFLTLARKNKNFGVESTKQIKEDIDYADSINAHTFSFSGGEPTLRKDLPSLVKYAKSKNIKKIQIQSNGRMFYYKKYCKLLIDAGANEFAISFHSLKEDIQDKLMGVKGSYKQTLKGIKNLREFDQEVKISIVITKLNYKDIPQLTKMLLDLGVSEIRYDFVTVSGYVKNNPKAIVPKMSEAVPYIKECLNMFDPKKAWMAVFNIPYCLLKEYPGHIVDMVQPATQLRSSEFVVSIKDNRRRDKKKLKKCKSCIYDKICFGIWEEYIKIYGYEEINPVVKKTFN